MYIHTLFIICSGEKLYYRRQHVQFSDYPKSGFWVLEVCFVVKWVFKKGQTEQGFSSFLFLIFEDLLSKMLRNFEKSSSKYGNLP